MTILIGRLRTFYDFREPWTFRSRRVFELIQTRVSRSVANVCVVWGSYTLGKINGKNFFLSNQNTNVRLYTSRTYLQLSHWCGHDNNNTIRVSISYLSSVRSGSPFAGRITISRQCKNSTRARLSMSRRDYRNKHCSYPIFEVGATRGFRTVSALLTLAG